MDGMGPADCLPYDLFEVIARHCCTQTLLSGRQASKELRQAFTGAVQEVALHTGLKTDDLLHLLDTFQNVTKFNILHNKPGVSQQALVAVLEAMATRKTQAQELSLVWAAVEVCCKGTLGSNLGRLACFTALRVLRLDIKALEPDSAEPFANAVRAMGELEELDLKLGGPDHLVKAMVKGCLAASSSVKRFQLVCHESSCAASELSIALVPLCATSPQLENVKLSLPLATNHDCVVEYEHNRKEGSHKVHLNVVQRSMPHPSAASSRALLTAAAESTLLGHGLPNNLSAITRLTVTLMRQEPDHLDEQVDLGPFAAARAVTVRLGFANPEHFYRVPAAEKVHFYNIGQLEEFKIVGDLYFDPESAKELTTRASGLRSLAFNTMLLSEEMLVPVIARLGNLRELAQVQLGFADVGPVARCASRVPVRNQVRAKRVAAQLQRRLPHANISVTEYTA